MTVIDTGTAVQRLIDAQRNIVATTALTGDLGEFDAATAYDLQAQVVADRVQRGSAIVGAKLGLTSEAKQKQMKVSEPLYGWLTDDMRIDPGQAIYTERYIQPRVETEIAFLLGRDLEGPTVGAAEVLAATAGVMAGVDVLDSRYAGYSFTLPDVIADNASSAGFITGFDMVEPRGFDLRLLGVTLEINGVLRATASGAAALGHPASSIAWMVRAMARRGEGLTAGMVLFSGALTEAVAVKAGDTVVARVGRLGSVEAACR